MKTTAIIIAVFATLSAVCSAQRRSRPLFITGETGRRTGTNQNSQTATASGGILLQDIYMLEKLRRFNLERIPERVVHARGVGAIGEFVSTVDFS